MSFDFDADFSADLDKSDEGTTDIGGSIVRLAKLSDEKDHIMATLKSRYGDERALQIYEECLNENLTKHCMNREQMIQEDGYENNVYTVSKDTLEDIKEKYLHDAGTSSLSAAANLINKWIKEAEEK